MSKIERIIKLIEEKSSMLYDEYAECDATEDSSEIRTELLGQLSILNEVWEDIKIIQSEDV